MLRLEALLATLPVALFLGSASIRSGAAEPSANAPGSKESATEAVSRALSVPDWAGIREAHEVELHAAQAEQDELRARNPGQQWVARFDGLGFSVLPDAGGWEWGLQLERYGYAGMERDVDRARAVSTAGQHIRYVRDELLEEWWINDRRGLEHGFTLRERPACAADVACPLIFTLAVRGALRPEPTSDGRSVRFVDARGRAVVTYAGLLVVDANGAELPARFERSDDGLALSIEDAGARYPLTIDPVVQQAYLKASSSDAGDAFGSWVAVSGNTVVVGAPFEDSGATGVNGNDDDDSTPDSGAAYVFIRDGTSWSQQAYLKASNGRPGDEFGQSVAISGDTIVVGARFASFNIGAAYVFVRSGSTWNEQAILSASNADFGDRFGSSVAVSGDTIVVGASFEDSAATGVNGIQSNNNRPDSGAAYVFVRSSGTWIQQAYLKASNTGTLDEFGAAVALSDDLVLVGAPSEDSDAEGVNGNQGNNSLSGSGAAYVFVRSGSTWSQQAYLKSLVSTGPGFFGTTVAASGNTVAAGASANGRTDVFVHNGSSWSHQFHVSMLDHPSVALAGDVLVIGTSVYMRNGTTWRLDDELEASNPNPDDRFGRAVGVSTDAVIVGAPLEDGPASGVNGPQGDGLPDSGAAYAYQLIVCPQSAVAFRNAGTNPVSYSAGPIVIGGTFHATVDNAVAGQFTSAIFAFDSPVTVPLAMGQTVLCLDLNGTGELFTGGGLRPSTTGFFGTDTYSFPLANLPSMCGTVLYSQALHFGFPPFELSNAQDFTVGNY